MSCTGCLQLVLKKYNSIKWYCSPHSELMRSRSQDETRPVDGRQLATKSLNQSRISATSGRSFLFKALRTDCSHAANVQGDQFRISTTSHQPSSAIFWSYPSVILTASSIFEPCDERTRFLHMLKLVYLSGNKKLFARVLNKI